MRIIGCDLHACQQTPAMLDTVSGEVVARTLMHEGNEVRVMGGQVQLGPHPITLCGRIKTILAVLDSTTPSNT